MEYPNYTHPTEDEMELYAMHKAAEPVVENIEEHLLLCERCRSELDEVELKIRVLRIVLREAEPSCAIQ
jgi:hypothetical protein